MARQIRIDALASECGVAPREVLRVLIELGQFRYTRFNQQLAEDLAGQVRAALVPASTDPKPSTGGGDVDFFAQAMSAAGVQPLDRRGSKPSAPAKQTSKKKPSAKAKGGRSRVAPAPSPVAEPAPAPAPEPTPPPETPPAVQPPLQQPGSSAELAPEATATVEPAPPVQDQHAAALAGLRAQLEGLQQEHDALRTEHRQALAHAAALEVRSGELLVLSGKLVEARDGQVAAEGVGLLDLLQDRGLRGLDEAGFALRALLEAHLLDSSLSFLRSLDPDRLRRILGDRLCLCCGREACGHPGGVEVVRVPLHRCELCGGQELPRVHQAYSDACLLSGINRVVLVGGKRWHHAWHDAGLDRRVQVRLWAGTQPLVERTLEEDLAWAQLVLLWDDGALSAPLAAAVEQHRGHGLLRVESGSMGGLLEQAAAGIEGLDPAELA